MKALFLFLTIALCSGLMAQNTAKPDSVWLFASFKDPGNGGIWFAHSPDGLNWVPAYNDQPLLVHDLTKGKMRDPFICRDQNNEFHMLWTSGLGRIGHAT